ncbi:hypothetical protein EHR02_07980 [Leptospira levettii]|uniref:hypothetical protein n=1 Tax=Leptospira levettii TaxID=2023178 RepID=UPI0010846376|nr:hypothetical protein [Leptospira levettii]TGM92719.1 hypothetical protein EHR02_07980 [Leptospira levettii]
MINYRAGNIANTYELNQLITKICPHWNFSKESFEFINNRLNNLKQDLTFAIEYPYVDSIYRDSYYEYFASKHIPYDRNSIRITLFSQEVNFEKLVDGNSEYIESFRSSFLGFIILRPTIDRPVARSVISPKALKNHNFEICLARYTIEFFGQKLSVNGFPHISQDGEAITCAESSLWTLLEYYSSKYKDYNPITPSKLRKLIRSTTGRRMIPSNGLTIAEISYAISELGFTSLVYHNKDQSENILHEEIYTYIESGIPIILGLEAGENFRHAIVCFGHSIIDLAREVDKFEINSEKLIDISCLPRNFISMDDNRTPYLEIQPNSLGVTYTKQTTAKITFAIVPLNKRIYMESTIARALAKKILLEFKEIRESREPLFIRLFLTTSRSFKQSLFSPNTKMAKVIKKLLLYNSFPRFIWICEIGTAENFRNEQGQGLLILDATGGNSNSSILFYYFDKKLRNSKDLTSETDLNSRDSLLFSLYKNNLKGEWNDWET